MPLILCDGSGNAVANLEVDHTLRWERSRAASVTFLLGYDQVGASDLLSMIGNQIPTITAYRNKSLIFSGIWSPQQETADGTEEQGITCEFRSPFSRLETRYLNAAVTYTNAEQNAGIAWNLVSSSNQDGPTGLVQGTVQVSATLRNRAYAIGQQVAQALTDLSDLTNVGGAMTGPLYTETFLDPSSGSIAALNIWIASQYGRDLTSDLLFEYGETTMNNIISVSRTIDYPINRVIVTPGAPPSGGTALTPVTVDDPVSQAAFGMFTTYVDRSNIVQNQDHLNDVAAALIQPYPIQQITFEPDPESAPQPIDDYWLNDLISFRAKQDNFNVDLTTAQISAIEMDRDGADNELAHRIEFGYQIVQPLIVIRRANHIVFRKPGRTGAPRSRHHRRSHRRKSI